MPHNPEDRRIGNPPDEETEEEYEARQDDYVNCKILEEK